MFIKPASPLVRVPDPSQAGTPGYWLPDEGREVESSMFWMRRLRDRDVVLATPPTAPIAAAPAVTASAVPAAPTA